MTLRAKTPPNTTSNNLASRNGQEEASIVGLHVADVDAYAMQAVKGSTTGKVVGRMKINRRSFIISAASAGTGNLGSTHLRRSDSDFVLHEGSLNPDAFSVVPVVGDGKWIWRKPPQDGSIGYLEPRKFEVTTGITFRGEGYASDIWASTVAPLQFLEQKVVDFKIETKGCDAKLLRLNETAAQLLLHAGQIQAGQVVSAIAKYRMKLSKDYRGFSKDSFPLDQTPPPRRKRGRDGPPVGDLRFSKRTLGSSPGISLRDKELKELSNELGTKGHPWDLAKKYYDWVWDNISAVCGKYTSVKHAIKNRRGDCEEKASVFIALCRAAGIPARLVWVPSHNWAEIGLYDHEGKPHWIPIHTAAYSWFGWTGVHEVVLQKGDRVYIKARKKSIRLIDDWYRFRGKRPKMYYSMTVQPLPSEAGGDPGPGRREKLKSGRWTVGGGTRGRNSTRHQ